MEIYKQPACIDTSAMLVKGKTDIHPFVAIATKETSMASSKEKPHGWKKNRPCAGLEPGTTTFPGQPL